MLKKVAVLSKISLNILGSWEPIISSLFLFKMVHLLQLSIDVVPGIGHNLFRLRGVPNYKTKVK